MSSNGELTSGPRLTGTDHSPNFEAVTESETRTPSPRNDDSADKRVCASEFHCPLLIKCVEPFELTRPTIHGAPWIRSIAFRLT